MLDGRPKATEKREVSKLLLGGGDSLSDRGMLAETKLFGIFSLKSWSGLDKAALNRFSDGFVWLDFLTKMLADKFDTEEQKKLSQLSHGERYEAYVNKMKREQEEEKLDASIENNNKQVKLRGRDFVRSYAIGGLTTIRYFLKPFTSFLRFISRFVLSDLKDMRDKVFSDDKKNKYGEKHKASTLVVEWSGANDLITVNDKPTNEIVDLAIDGRIDNARKFFKHGYRNYIFYNMPDLSLTPRYQNKANYSQQDREQAHACCLYFNNKLQNEIVKLRAEFPHCKIDAFDDNAKFGEIYRHPEDFNLDSNLKTSYFENREFDQPSTKYHNSLSQGYIYWNDVHPSEASHFQLGIESYNEVDALYNFVEPGSQEKKELKPLIIEDEVLIKTFKEKYEKTFTKDCNRFFFGEWSSHWFQVNDPNLRLIDILDHALNHGGTRTFKVLHRLGWLDEKGGLYLKDVPALKLAYERATTKDSPRCA